MIHWPALLASPQVKKNGLFCKWRPQTINSGAFIGQIPSLRSFVCSRGLARGDIRHTERNFRAKSWVSPSLNAQSTVGPHPTTGKRTRVCPTLSYYAMHACWGGLLFLASSSSSHSLSMQCLSDVVSTLYGTKFRTWVVITQIGNFTLPKFGIG